MSPRTTAYYRLTKPGIIYGNIMTAIGGFLFASRGHIEWQLLVAVLAGTSLVIASACVFNNYLDRDIDQYMERTRKRALVTGNISSTQALIFGACLGILGFTILLFRTNHITVKIGAIGFIAYVALYGYSKRKTVHGTLIGTVSGATPIVAGYCAAAGHFDYTAFILFFILVCWQMAHFYAIAIYRQKDYAAAHIPVLPVVHGIESTKKQITAYLTAFLIAIISLTIFSYSSYTYLIAMGGLSTYWLWRGLNGYKTADPIQWARRLFISSLTIILALSVTLSLDAWLP